VSEFQTPLSVWQGIMEEREPGWNEKHGYTLPEPPDNAAIRFGTAFESAVVELAERAQRAKIIHRERFFACNDFGGFAPVISLNEGERENCITCHVDGIYNLPLMSDPVRLHEGKTTSAFSFREKWGEPGTDKIPQAYQVQVQHQMLCTGAEEAIVSVLIWPRMPDECEKDGIRVIQQKNGEWDMGNNGVGKSVSEVADNLAFFGFFHQYPCKANPEAQRRMVEAYREFWEKHVLAGAPPEPKNYDDLKRLLPAPKHTVVVPPDMERKFAEHRDIGKEKNNGAERQDALRLEILSWGMKQTGTEDDESLEAMIFRNEGGQKLGAFSKDKNGRLVFRVS
jgi:hypothetical protein